MKYLKHYNEKINIDFDDIDYEEFDNSFIPYKTYVVNTIEGLNKLLNDIHNYDKNITWINGNKLSYYNDEAINIVKKNKNLYIYHIEKGIYYSYAQGISDTDDISYLNI